MAPASPGRSPARRTPPERRSGSSPSRSTRWAATWRRRSLLSGRRSRRTRSSPRSDLRRRTRMVCGNVDWPAGSRAVVASSRADLRRHHAMDAKPRRGKGEQPLPSDGAAARLAAAEPSLIDPLDGGVRLLELGERIAGGVLPLLQRLSNGRATLYESRPCLGGHRHHAETLIQEGCLGRPTAPYSRIGAPGRRRSRAWVALRASHAITSRAVITPTTIGCSSLSTTGSASMLSEAINAPTV